MKLSKKLVAFILSAVLLFGSVIPVSAVDFDYTIEKGSVLGSGEGDDVRIWFSVYSNGGWSSAKQIPSKDTVAHRNPVLQNFGEYVRLYYKVGSEIAHWVTKYVDSYDNGATWTEAKELVEGDTSGGRGPVKNKCLVTSKGIIIAPASTEQGD